MCRIAASLLLLFSCVLARAETLDTIVQSVDGRSPAEFEQARYDGLEQLLVRLTGQAEVAELPGVASLLDNPEPWLMRYHYQSDDRLVLNYDGQGLRRYLSRQGVPVWGERRPVVLLWFVDQSQGRGSVLTKTDPLYPHLQAVAARRGLQIMVPAWDGQDQYSLNLGDIRGRFDEPLIKASSRYQADLLAPVVFYPGSPARMSWRLLQGGKELSAQRRQPFSAENAIEQLVSDLSEVLVVEFAGGQRPALTQAARSEISADGILLEISGINSLALWQESVQALQALSGVTQIRLAQIDGENLVYALNFADGEAQLRRQLSLASSLRECPGGERAQSLHYCWRR